VQELLRWRHGFPDTVSAPAYGSLIVCKSPKAAVSEARTALFPIGLPGWRSPGLEMSGCGCSDRCLARHRPSSAQRDFQPLVKRLKSRCIAAKPVPLSVDMI
jgi:hypothetical protein